LKDEGASVRQSNRITLENQIAINVVGLDKVLLLNPHNMVLDEKIDCIRDFHSICHNEGDALDLVMKSYGTRTSIVTEGES